MSRLAIVIENNCAGFILRRRHQYEAFDAAEKSLGLFDSEDSAVTAILNPLPTKEPENART